MKAFVFPGQGSQFPGMAKELYQTSSLAKELFEKANIILGFDITEIMFNGTEEQLKQTKVTQPAIFLHSVILARVLGKRFEPQMVAGHSLGEWSAVVAVNALGFEDGLRLVSQRAMAMQKACELEPSTMAAIMGMKDTEVEEICSRASGIVVCANYNCPGQIVISGALRSVEEACRLASEAGAKRALKLAVSGGFHSPMMEPARAELEKAVNAVQFNNPLCPVYQNVTAMASTTGDAVRENLLAQLTKPVRWTQTIEKMISDGASAFIETGPGKVLQGLIKKVNKDIITESIQL